jgi:hypothetical protein
LGREHGLRVGEGVEEVLTAAEAQAESERRPEAVAKGRRIGELRKPPRPARPFRPPLKN